MFKFAQGGKFHLVTQQTNTTTNVPLNQHLFEETVSHATYDFIYRNSNSHMQTLIVEDFLIGMNLINLDIYRGKWMEASGFHLTISSKVSEIRY